MDKELLQRFGISNAAADFLKDQKTTREALELMNPGAQVTREITRMQEAIDPMRALRQSELAHFGELNGALKQLQLHYLESPLREYAEIEKASTLAHATLQYEAAKGYPPASAIEALERSASLFTVPTGSATQDYLEAFQNERTDFLNAARTSLQDDGLRDALAQMRSPWLDINNVPSSISGVIGLRELAQSLSTRQPFDLGTTQLVRQALGDWRDFTTPTSPATSVAADREVLYRERGLEPTLVGFPPQAFDQLIEDTGLTAESDAVFALFDSEMPVIDVSEAAMHRATVAFERLLRFEIYLRRFINDAMTKAFGEDWPRRQLPPNVYNDWKGKRSRAESNGGTAELLIDYADFTHYLMIIQRNDNWSTVFKPLFNRKEDVVESLQRLCPLRIDAMHARPMNITNGDLLMLYVETTRIVGVTRKHAERLQ